MPHHRHAALGQEGDGLRHARAAFDLDGAAAGFLQHARGVHEGLLLGRLVRCKRHVDDDQRALGAAHHGVALQDHHLERDRHGGLQTVHHHAERVADQDHVAIFVDQPRGMGVIRREAHDRRAALAGEDVGRGEPPDLVLH